MIAYECIVLLGLTVSSLAAPTPVKNIEERQGGGVWIGPPNPTISCIPEIQEAYHICIIAPPVSTLKPSDKKRQEFTLPPDGDEALKAHLVDLEQKLESLQAKQHKSREDEKEIERIQRTLAKYGISVSAPPGTSTTITPGKRQTFTLPPDADQGLKDYLTGLETQVEALQAKPNKTWKDEKEIERINRILAKYGISVSAPPGGSTTITPGKRQTFTLPPDADQGLKDYLTGLETQVEALQAKPNKTWKDEKEIDRINRILAKYGISVSAPPGGSTTITPGKRQTFTLPPDADQDLKDYLTSIEVELENLEAKHDKSKKDEQEIEHIKSILKYFGISVSSPPGTSTTITPGKRQTFTLPPDGSTDFCSNVAGLEVALESLEQSEASLTPSQYFSAQRIKWMLLACGITVIKSPDGTTTTLVPGKKLRLRDIKLPSNSNPGFELAGLEKAYENLLQGLDGATPSFVTGLALQYIADVLDFYGIAIDKSPAGTTTTLVPGKRQSGIFTIGGSSCSVSDIVGLKAALATLTLLYGSPNKAPANIFLLEQAIVTGLQYCNQTVPGWTTITPGNPIPGGGIIPDPTSPGGGIIPDPTTPGGAITPDPTTPGGAITPDPANPGGPFKPPRDAPVLTSGDAALLKALQDLQAQYGDYGSLKAPAPIFIIIQNIVTTLQLDGVTVPGWPSLIGSSTTITQSS